MRLLRVDTSPRKRGIRLTGSMERANGDPFDTYIDYDIAADVSVGPRPMQWQRLC